MDERALRELNAAMVRLGDGDRGACAIVFALMWPELVTFAERVLGKGPDADDASQQALEKIFAQASDYDPDRSALAWGFAIVAWECRTILQKRRRRREEPLDHARLRADERPDPQALNVEQAMRVALSESLAQLPPADRVTLEEAFSSDTSGPHGPAFRKRKERALTRLRAAWRKVHGD